LEHSSLLLAVSVSPLLVGSEEPLPPAALVQLLLPLPLPREDSALLVASELSLLQAALVLRPAVSVAVQPVAALVQLLLPLPREDSALLVASELNLLQAASVGPLVALALLLPPLLLEGSVLLVGSAVALLLVDLEAALALLESL
jgi:hypothetical protein